MNTYQDYVEDYEIYKKYAKTFAAYKKGYVNKGVINDFGVILIYDNGVLHNEDGPAVFTDTNVQFKYEGKTHRVSGPSQIFANGSWNYFHHGRRHRLDGPASYSAVLDTYKWYVNGKDVSFQANMYAKQNNVDILNLDEDNMVLFKLFMSGFNS